MKYLFLLSYFLVFFVVPDSLWAQDRLRTDSNRTGPTYLPTTIVDGEAMPWVLLPEVVVTGYRIFKTPEDRARYNRLKYNVLKVMPYARFAEQRYEKLQRELALTSNKKEQKKLVRQCEKEIKDMFNKEIKKMTVSQGEILVKLIDRQTGNSSYELVKELRGGVTAFFYQSVAKVFGHNLKNTYDPEQERDIENIIRKYQHSYYYFN